MAARDEYDGFDALHLHAIFLAVLDQREDAESTIRACTKVLDDILDARNQLNQEKP